MTLKKFHEYTKKLIYGSATAQAIAILALPLLTRLYSPEDFRILAAYTGVHTIILSITCLKYEAAIALPEKDEDGAIMLVISIISLIIVTLFTLIIIMAWMGLEIEAMYQYADMKKYIWLLPASIFFAGAYVALQNWAARCGRFNDIARTRVEQSFGGTIVQIGGGVLSVGVVGLLVGQLINTGAGTVRLAIKAWQNNAEIFKNTNLENIKLLAKRYDKFPKYVIFESVSGNASLQLPMVLLASTVIGPEAGYFYVALRTMQMPLTLIGSAVSQVYLPHAAHLNRGEELTNLTQMLLRSIINIGIGPILLLGMISEIIFPLILGDNWARVGAIIKWMTPWLLLQLLVSPISTVMHVTERQHVALYLNIFGLAIRIIPICILIALDSMKYFAEVFSIVSALYYLTWLNWCLKVTNLSVTQLITKKSLIIVCTWLAIGQIISRNLSN